LKVVTEATLRAGYNGRDGQKVIIDPDAYLTQTARDFIREKNLEVVYESESGETYVNEANDQNRQKPEHMTHLRGRLLVCKSHPRIALRGKLDSLQARIIETQLIAYRTGQMGVVEALDEILTFTRRILACEAKESPFGPVQLFGLSDEALRERSHNPQKYYGIDHILPSYHMGEVAAALNMLRTYARESELYAVRAFRGREKETDIIRALNRLSSGIYIILCRVLAEVYTREAT
jgi:ethanolamine utilization cobalamin adenosyltransferase